MRETFLIFVIISARWTNINETSEMHL